MKKIVGYFKLRDIIVDHPKNLWDRLSEVSGLKEDEFFDYFQNREVGYALDLKDFKPFNNPIDPKDLNPKFKPPQSFCYFHLPNEDLNIK